MTLYRRISTSSPSREFGRRAVRTDVESDDDGARGQRQQNVRLGDGAGRGTQDSDSDLLRRDLGNRLLQSFEGSLHVGLDEHRQFLDAAFGDVPREALERAPRGFRERGDTLLLLAESGDLAGLHLVRDPLEEISRRGLARKTHDLDGSRRAGRADAPAMFVGHGAHLAERGARDKGVADSKRPALHEDRGDDAPRAVELGFEHDAVRRLIDRGLEVGDVRHEEDHLEKLFDSRALFRGDFARDDLTAVFLDQDVAVGELLLDAVGARIRLVDLVDGDDDRDARGLRVVDGFDGLRLDTVVRCNDEHHDVGDADAARSHECERFVAGGVEERDLAPALFDLVGADVLRDSAVLAADHVRCADRVEQRRFSVIDVAHHGNDRRPGNDDAGAGDGQFEVRHGVLALLVLERDDHGVGPEFLRDFDRHGRVERLVDVREHAPGEKLRDDVLGFSVQLLGEFLHRHRFRELNRRRHRRQIRFRPRRRRRNVEPLGAGATGFAVR